MKNKEAFKAAINSVRNKIMHNGGIENFLSAVQFLTIIPLKAKDATERNIVSSCAFFPLAGAAIGLILFAIYALMSSLFLGPFVSSAITIISLAIISGGLHLDGLADTFDALAGGKDKKDKLEIMRDSHIGTMGVLALISVFLLKIFLFSEIANFHKFAALMAMTILSRWSQVFSLRTFTYAREEGKAKIFFSGIDNKVFFYAFLSALLLIILLFRIEGLYLFIASSVFAFAVGKFFSGKFGGITGDNLGALNEITEVVVLCSLLILQRNL